MGQLSDYRGIVGAQVKPYRCDRSSSGISGTSPTLDNMPFFGKSRSTPNLCWQISIPWNDLEECLKIEHLMEDMHQEYSYMFWPYQHFQHPTPLTLYQVLAKLKSTKHWLAALQLTVRYACYLYSCSTFLSPLLLWILLIWKLCSCSTNPFPVYSNSNPYFPRLLSHCRKQRDLWQTNGNNWTSLKSSKLI
jgi:hypothetical protein